MFVGLAAFKTRPRIHLAPTQLVPTMRLTPRLIRRLLQLSLPVVATLVVFPALAAHWWQVFSDGGVPAAMLSAVTVCAIAGVALGAAPGPEEPDVHDRQLDVILAVFFIGGCVWLLVAWPERFAAGEPLSGHQIIAATALLIGVYLVVAGTRLTARLRLVLILPLIAMPTITEQPSVLALLVGTTVAGTLLLTVLRVRRGSRSAAPVAAENAKTSIEDALLPTAASELPVWNIESSPRRDVNSSEPSPEQRASGGTHRIRPVHALATEAGASR